MRKLGIWICIVTILSLTGCGGADESGKLGDENREQESEELEKEEDVVVEQSLAVESSTKVCKRTYAEFNKQCSGKENGCCTYTDRQGNYTGVCVAQASQGFYDPVSKWLCGRTTDDACDIGKRCK